MPHGCTVRLVDLAKFNDKPKSKRSKKGSQSPCLSDNIGRWMATSHLEKDLPFLFQLHLIFNPTTCYIDISKIYGNNNWNYSTKRLPHSQSYKKISSQMGFSKTRNQICRWWWLCHQSQLEKTHLPRIQDFDAQTCFLQFQIHLTRLYLKTPKIKLPPKSRG